jgi:hypothetical protein
MCGVVVGRFRTPAAEYPRPASPIMSTFDEATTKAIGHPPLRTVFVCNKKLLKVRLIIVGFYFITVGFCGWEKPFFGKD